MAQEIWRRWRHGPRTAIFENSGGGGGGGGWGGVAHKDRARPHPRGTTIDHRPPPGDQRSPLVHRDSATAALSVTQGKSFLNDSRSTAQNPLGDLTECARSLVKSRVEAPALRTAR